MPTISSSILPTIQPTPDSVEEFRIITNTFDAEYGRNSGSVVNVITKSGTNGFHGNFYEYFRNTVLNAQGYSNTRSRSSIRTNSGEPSAAPSRKTALSFSSRMKGSAFGKVMPGIAECSDHQRMWGRLF